MGSVAQRLRLPPLVGYLFAGILIGPFTPGYVADQELANELAEIGVILLMFGVGLHFSLKDLLAVKTIAIPGAIVQIAVATALGAGLGWWLGWDIGGGLIFGLALSVASTVVLLRAMQERRLLETERGRIAVGWLIVEDLVMVLALVLIPALANGGGEGGQGLGLTIAITLGKVAAFVAIMLIAGRRFIPWLLHLVAHSGSRELFRLSVLAVALGVAFGAAMLFGVSFALGAFFAGMILAESPLSARAAQETLPLRDAFAVLFFVSVGMLFNPSVLLDAPLALLATVAIILIGKSIAAFVIVLVFGRGRRTALTISASLAQIGEFSFILATLGTQLELLPPVGRNLILAGAILSILLNPLLFVLADRFVGKAVGVEDEHPMGQAPPAPAKGPVVLVGFGRVGRYVAKALIEADEPMVLIETQEDLAGLPKPNDNVRLVFGNAASGDVLSRARIEKARMLFVAIPDPFEAGQVAEQARKMNPTLRIVARAHTHDHMAHVTEKGADVAIMGEEEIARRMVEDALTGH
ncbi:YbaL family putative K(+) efflux transporter [Sphingomonas naphthae]|uniref:YbaL family putative K(+) efflux transporter n=1 Tax=Sphingomonas naphthae TaxID=1813468 RepID=A0ABY7TU96_9SPHN|nr:YbaL family putative K(+) efflux transporter [Sphingomonas naphthae]WCT75429.1 YbaL family putative K(+) efflux transporter [Sphingomonas naphthae]